MNHGGSWTFDFGKVKYVNAIILTHFLMGQTVVILEVVIEGEHKNIYIAGTALTMDMKLILCVLN
jgi:hypothetical protein